MKIALENDTLILFPEGRINSANAPHFDKNIKDLTNIYDHKKIILNIENLEYISSAGLRVILRLRKSCPSLSIINASSEVYEILDMTGFTEMIPVSKAFRTLSVDGCQQIGEGSNGIVYRYKDDIIVKVYKNSDALDEIKRERELARSALVLGINTAIPYDVVKVGETYGSVFEMLNSRTLSQWINNDPEHIDKYIRVLCDMLKEIHSTAIEDESLPSMKRVYLNYVRFLKDHLSKEDALRLKEIVESVPESNHVIHGDFHTNNVHYDGNEAILIDMDTLAVGDPVFEFASIFLAYRGFNELDNRSSSTFLKMNGEHCKYIYSKLLQYYFAENSDYEEYDDLIRLLGYTRLLRRTIRRSPEREDDISMLKAKLKKYLMRV